MGGGVGGEVSKKIGMPKKDAQKGSVVDVWQGPDYASELPLGEGNLIFCCMGSQESYFGSVGRQNNKSKFQGRQI